MKRQRLAVLLAAAAASACSARATPPVHHYRLSYAPPRLESTAPPVVLRVAPFRIAAVYASEAILYRESEVRLEAYRYHRWSADPARMITDLLQRDLAASGAFRAVQQGPSSLPSDYVLRGEIEEIEERSAPACAAHLRLRALLAVDRAQADAVVFQRVYEADEPARCGRAGELVEAMSRALERLSAELQRDVLSAVRERSSESPQ